MMFSGRWGEICAQGGKSLSKVLWWFRVREEAQKHTGTEAGVQVPLWKLNGCLPFHEIGSRASVKSRDEDRHLGVSRELWKTESGIVVGEH